ncbi:MAG: XdhC family protein [Pseudomonadota bacterium]
MNKLDISVLESISKWQSQRFNVVLVTVAHTWGSSPRPRGSMLAWCRETGQFMGSVSGGCIEDDLLQAFANKPPVEVEVKNYGVSAAAAAARGLPCGGRLTVVIEPLFTDNTAEVLLKQIANRERVLRRINLVSGETELLTAGQNAQTLLGEEYFDVLFEAEWRMLIIGAGELSQFVHQFASSLGFAVSVCDPRENYRESWPHDETAVSDEMPDDFIVAAHCDEQTAIVALTHDPKIDDLAILEALNSGAFYVGALGSKRTNNARRTRLAEHFDLSEETLALMRGPIGIDLNTRNAAEIALSIVTEIVARRNGVSIATERAEMPQ